ncbi:hypothetical protein ACQ86N_28925 [Puia sp. P3]|uniref:DinB/UmuC family translesion DNA polymerase n=1 Tax=Puia sp. P3 TaxID=3423952 RepID=UPI003D66AFBA
MRPALEKIAGTVVGRLVRNKLKGRTITVKIKYADFRQITRSKSFARGTDELEVILLTSIELLVGSGLEDKKVRLLGITVSNFEGAAGLPAEGVGGGQMELF